MDATKLWRIAEAVPPAWYGGDLGEIERLMEQMLARRGRVRELIVSFRDSSREPFPLWTGRSSVAVPAQFIDMGRLGVAGKFVM